MAAGKEVVAGKEVAAGKEEEGTKMVSAKCEGAGPQSGKDVEVLMCATTKYGFTADPAFDGLEDLYEM